jgi:hypothetical protein
MDLFEAAAERRLQETANGLAQHKTTAPTGVVFVIARRNWSWNDGPYAADGWDQKPIAVYRSLSRAKEECRRKTLLWAINQEYAPQADYQVPLDFDFNYENYNLSLFTQAGLANRAWLESRFGITAMSVVVPKVLLRDAGDDHDSFFRALRLLDLEPYIVEEVVLD